MVVNNKFNKLYSCFRLSYFLFLWTSFFYISAHAAGYDCQNASTNVEKMICNNDPLSAMDDELNRAYTKLVKSTENQNAVKLKQKKWLKKRNKCKNLTCLKNNYQNRIHSLHMAINSDVNSNFYGQESHRFESEDKKLSYIIDIAKKYDFAQKGVSKNKYEICESFFSEFVGGKYIEAVEPVFYSWDKDDVRLDAFNECKTKEFPEGLKQNNFYYVTMLGGPPYRYYKVDLNRDNKNKKEDVLYHEFTGIEGHTGYSWVNLKACEVNGGVTIETVNRDFIDYNFEDYARLSLILIYKNIPWVLNIKPSSPEALYYYIKLSKIKRKEKPYICSWVAELPK